MLRLPRKLLLRLIGALVLAFVLSMAVTWKVQTLLTDRNARVLMNRILDDVQREIEDEVNRKMVLTAMVARDALPKLPDLSVGTLRGLADELRVDEVSVVDAKGLMIGSTLPGGVGLDLRTLGGQATEFLKLLDSETEVAQPIRPSFADGVPRKFVGVWLPKGGFVQVACTPATLRRVALATITGITHNRHVGSAGAVIVTTEEGQVISGAKEMGLEGSIFQPPGEGHYVICREIEGFPVTAILPKSAATSERNAMIGTSAVLTLTALVFVALLVGVAIARFVREQIEHRVAEDLRMARSIQASSLPNVFPPFPTLVDVFDIHARMRPAREVGGDFYDFYHVGPDVLALVVADVSGKGVPAAMFMMRAKTTLKAHLASGGDLTEKIRRVNAALCEGNDDALFMTAWIGLVDLASGRVRYVNAGHNAPIVRTADGGVRSLVEPDPSLPLAALEGISYEQREFVLNPGDLLFLYSDGLPEAMDPSAAFYGDERLEAAIAAAPQASSEVCQEVFASVDAFAAGAPQADDMTELAFRYLAPPGGLVRKSLPAATDSLAACEELVTAAGLESEVLVILDEIVSNIVRCSGATSFDFEIRGKRELVFADDGVPFDPTAHADPGVTLDPAERPVGGLGLFLVKKLAESVAYRRDGNRNILTVRLRQNQPS